MATKPAAPSVNPFLPKVGLPKQSTPPVPVNPFLPNASPAANVSQNKPFVGPTLDPEVMQERTKLTQQGFGLIFENSEKLRGLPR